MTSSSYFEDTGTSSYIRSNIKLKKICKEKSKICERRNRKEIILEIFTYKIATMQQLLFDMSTIIHAKAVLAGMDSFPSAISGTHWSALCSYTSL